MTVSGDPQRQRSGRWWISEAPVHYYNAINYSKTYIYSGSSNVDLCWIVDAERQVRLLSGNDFKNTKQKVKGGRS